MRLLGRLFGRKASASDTVGGKTSAEGTSLAFIFLCDALPALDEADISKRLEAFGRPHPPLRLSDYVAGEGTVHAMVSSDQHTLRLVGFDVPAPKDAIERSIECSHWRQEDKQPLRDHKAHLICYYIIGDNDPTEQIIAILKLAGAFLDSRLVGIVDPDAWNCMPSHSFKEMLVPQMLASCRAAVPVGLWTGFVKTFKTEDDVWFCSKGFHRWGVLDFAFLGKHAQADEAFGFFNDLFNYARKSKAILKAGHTAEVGGGVFLKFAPVTEYRDHLEGPLGTLVVQKVSGAEIRK